VLVGPYGLIPLDPALDEEQIPVIITGVYPTTALNPQGDNVLTLTGSGFPASLEEGSVIDITLSDGTSCIVFFTSPTEMKCRT